MFFWIQFVTTSLWDWYNKTSAKATAHENCHYAEVKNHCAMSIHLFNWCDTVFHFISKIWSITAFWWNLTKWSWFVNIDLRIKLDKRKWQLLSHTSSFLLCDLSKICNFFFDIWFDWMKFVPKVLLDLIHITPCIHSISFNIFDWILIFLLFCFITFNIHQQIGFFRCLNNHVCYFLRSLYFVNLHIFLKFLLYYIRDWHVIHFWRSFDFGIWDENFSLLIISLNEAIGIRTRRTLYLSKRNWLF